MKEQDSEFALLQKLWTYYGVLTNFGGVESSRFVSSGNDSLFGMPSPRFWTAAKESRMAAMEFWMTAAQMTANKLKEKIVASVF